MRRAISRRIPAPAPYIYHLPAAAAKKAFSLPSTSRNFRPPREGFRSVFVWESKPNSSSLSPQRRPYILIRMSKDRSPGRNVHIYSANDTSTVIGGLIVTDCMTNPNLYSMVEITYILDKDYKLRYEGGTIVQRDDNPLQPGKYFITLPSPSRPTMSLVCSLRERCGLGFLPQHFAMQYVSAIVDVL